MKDISSWEGSKSLMFLRMWNKFSMNWSTRLECLEKGLRWMSRFSGNIMLATWNLLRIFVVFRYTVEKKSSIEIQVKKELVNKYIFARGIWVKNGFVNKCRLASWALFYNWLNVLAWFHHCLSWYSRNIPLLCVTFCIWSGATGVVFS